MADSVAYDLNNQPLRYSPTVTVSTRRSWREEWTPRHYLWCDQVTFECNPGVGSAVFQWRYGVGVQHDALGPAIFAPLDLLHHFVRVEITLAEADGGQTILWHGVIVGDGDRRDGGTEDPSTQTPRRAGQQYLTATGLVSVLDVETISRALARAPDVENFSNSDTPEATELVEIPRAIGWNLGRGRPGDNLLRPNRDHTDAETHSVFSRALDDARQVTDGAEFWTARQILKYLLTFCAPACLPDENTGERIPLVDVRLYDDDGAEAETPLLDSWKPPVQAEPRTVKEILDELLDRRRLHGYRVDLADGPDPVLVIRPFSFARTELTLPDDTTIAPNPWLRTLALDRLIDASLSIRRTAPQQCRQAVAQGDFYGAVVYLCERDPQNQSNASGPLVKDWTDALQTQYNQAASTAGTYPSDPFERMQRNKEFRAQDKLQRVFSYLRLPAHWSGRQGHTGWTNGAQIVFPVYEETGTPDGDAPSINVWPPGVKLGRFLPLREGLDYSSNNIASGLVTSNLTDSSGAQPEWRPMFGLIKYDSRWIKLDTLGVDRGNPTGIPFTVSVRPQEDAAGVICTVQGAQQYQFASQSEYTAPDDSDELQLFASDNLNWHYAVFVCHLQSDQRVECRYPADADLTADTDHLPTLTIPVPDAHLDWVPPNTIVDVADGALVQTGSLGGFVRDDRPRLQRAARLAFEWYGRPRRSIEFTFQRIEPQFEIGHLITDLVSDDAGITEPVDSVITQITYDLLRNTTRVVTDFAQLDLAAAVKRSN